MTMAEQVDTSGCFDAIAGHFLPAALAGRPLFEAADLHQTSTALPLLQTALNLHPGQDRAAVISMWSQWYFARLFASWVRINLQFNWQLPVAPQAYRFMLQETGMPLDFVLLQPGRAIGDPGSMARFMPMIDAHITPVCHTLSALSGIKPGLFWNNAAIRIMQGMNHASQEGADISAATEFLATRTLPDGSPNRLFQPMRQLPDLEGNLSPCRRQCCLRYKLHDVEYCPSCPLLRKAKRPTADNRSTDA